MSGNQTLNIARK